jgi:hypothetical protein
VFFDIINFEIIQLFSGHLEKFLRHFDKSIQFEEKLTSVETACEVEYGGSKLFKYIHILVKVNLV